MPHRPPHRDAAGGDRTSQELTGIVGGDRHLVVFLEDGAMSYPLGELDAVVVGRGTDCHVQIDRTTLSRRHFAVRGAQSTLIEDLGSANGTRVNGRTLRAHTPTSIEADALIEAGGAFFALRDRRSRSTLRAALPSEAPELPAAPGVVVHDPVMASLHRLVREMAGSPLPVLVLGETGVGKEILAGAVHACSPRAEKPFLRINCAALPEALLESELFGYEVGAFTGAGKAKQGLIEAADGGTFFFDEIGEMPMTTQAKLLRVLESGELLRLGALKPRPIDVRFVAATHNDLQQGIRRGRFRRDLYYRLNGVTITIPPLRQRHGEIASLARLFASRAAASMGTGVVELSSEALMILERHSWPGNVRELKHVVERAVALCDGDVVKGEHITLDPPEPARDRGGPPSSARLAPPSSTKRAPAAGKRDRSAEGTLRVDPDAERSAIQDALRRAGGNQKRAAAFLGISRRTLLRRLDQHAVGRPRKSVPPSG
jgi:two-component system, NtrC family, response regulator AtoC